MLVIEGLSILNLTIQLINLSTLLNNLLFKIFDYRLLLLFLLFELILL